MSLDLYIHIKCKNWSKMSERDKRSLQQEDQCSTSFLLYGFHLLLICTCNMAVESRFWLLCKTLKIKLLLQKQVGGRVSISLEIGQRTVNNYQKRRKCFIYVERQTVLRTYSIHFKKDLHKAQITISTMFVLPCL